jgi:ParB family chromosome partitioning protein
MASPPKAEILNLAVDELRPNPFQPRKGFSEESMLQLAASIQARGLLQPIIARRKNGHYEIIAGERRWRVAGGLRMPTVPVVVREASDDQMLEFALIENLHREDLNAIDRARAYRQFREHFHLTPDGVAARIAEDRTTVINYMRLLELPESVQAMLREGRINMGHARALLGVPDNRRRIELATAVANRGWSVRALEETVRREKSPAMDSERVMNAGERARALRLRELQRRFEEAIKTKVHIHEGKRKGTGKIVIEYYSLDDFDRVAEKLGVALDDMGG